MESTRTISVGTFVASCFATTVGVIVSVSFLTFNVFHRHKRFMKMSSPKLNIVISVGGIILNIVCLMYGMDYFFAERYDEATVTCQMRLWMVVTAVTLVFGPIFAKSWRVYKIFRNAGIKKVVIKDARLFMFCGILLCLDAGILFMWQLVDLMESQAVTVLLKDSDRTNMTSQQQLTTIQECTCDKADVWFSLLFIWKSIVFSYGLYVAWKTRNILLPPMKDSPSIVISVVFTMCITSLTVLLSSLLRHDPDAVYILQILSITVCGTTVQITVFFPKVMYWWKTPFENTVQLSNSMYEYNDHSEEEIYQLIAENRTLKKSLNEKTSRLSNIEQHLQMAKDKLKTISQKDFKFDSKFDVDLSELKLDSGLDVDLSETTSTEDNISRGCHDNRTNVSETMLTDAIKETNNARIVEGLTQDNIVLQRSNSDVGNMIGYRQQRSRTSMYSLQNYNRPTAFYEFQESLKSKNDLVGSVAKSYNLDENEDTLSYVSSYIPLKSTRRKLNYALKDRDVYSSSEHVTTLSNDQLYPSFDEEFSSVTVVGKSSVIDTFEKPTVSIPKRQKKHRTPKASYERSKQGDKMVVRKCYYL